MSFGELRARARDAGETLHAWIREWHPINRSLTGDGVREQCARIAGLLPVELHRHETPTGAAAFDWTIPREWNVREAYIETPDGRRIADYAVHNLHLMGYSVPVRATMDLAELRGHLHSLPDRPHAIPYRTSYYKEQWGFCLPHAEAEALPEGTYRVHIDATLAPGHLTHAECVLPGDSNEEILFSAHLCHPSLANDNLSGIAAAVWLAREFAAIPRRYTWRFIFAPGTIGAINWLALNQRRTSLVRHGLILALLGGPAPPTYKASRQDGALVDRAARHVLRDGAGWLRDFSPYGYDERQYGSPGFNLPVGCFMRSEPGGYPEYHTSDDNPDFVRPEQLADSLEKIIAILEILEGDRRYRNLNPHCEPQLGKRGLYGAIGGGAKSFELALLWVLNLSDGEHALLDIAERAGRPFEEVKQAADALAAAGLLAPAD